MASFARPASKLIELLSDNSKRLSLTIVEIILLHLGIADIYSLHALSRSLRWLVDYITDSPCLLNITRQLQAFINDLIRFQRELGRHDRLIAGDFICNFFEFNH
ncbi:Aspartate aminotransferase, cytoplasmic [Fusarium oxysporum f. sp. albedinis]|nr:Aspartate aminotransferase, cytoplasmic [Fusarium oxysporum f. sp. albedinis]